jgi:hypothetical protein
MKQSLIFAIASILMLMISCSEEQPTKFSEYVFDKRNIENDTNWVEFHDYDTLDSLCFDLDEAYGGIIYNSESEYKEAFLKAMNADYKSWECGFMKIEDYTEPDIDFDTRSLLFMFWRDANVEYKRKIYYNQKQDEYFYLLTVDLVGYGAVMIMYAETLSLPKITNHEKLKFDTIFNSNGWQ